MKNRHTLKSLCVVAVLLIGLTATVLPGTAVTDTTLAAESTTIADISGTDNDKYTWSDGYDHGYIPNISAYQNSNGSYTVCVCQNNGTVKILELNRDFSAESEITVPVQLDKYAAFTKGTDGTYYLLFGADLNETETAATAMRLVNYSKSGQIIRSLDISANASGSLNGIAELFAGNNCLSANTNFITGYVGREMFPADETGIAHQASYGFAVNLSTFKQVTVSHTLETPYASHSFHQLIVQDGTDFIYVDRGDAEPKRSFHITKMSGNKSWKIKAINDSFVFKGDYGYNDTFSQLGGLVKTSAGYLLVGSYQNTTASLETTAANIFTQLYDSDTLDSHPVKFLTHYSGSKTDGVTNPKAVKISGNKIAVPYMVSNHSLLTEKMRIAIINDYGELIDDREVSYIANLPRFGQVFYSNSSDSIVWFSIAGGKLTAYNVALGTPAEQTTALPAAPSTTKPTDSTTEKPVSTTAQAPLQSTETTTDSATLPQETTTGQAEEEKPSEPTFLQKVFNFFAGIYHSIVNFFTYLFS